MASLKVVKKWENLFLCELDKTIEGRSLNWKHKNRITSIKGFSCSWICGIPSVKKGSLQKHLHGDPPKYAASFLKNEKLGASSFSEVAQHSAIGRGLVKMAMRNKCWKIILILHII